jgi:threonine synthase
MEAEHIEATAALVSALGWPIVVLVLLLTQRTPLTNALNNLKRIKALGLEAEMAETVRRGAERAIHDPGNGGNAPTVAAFEAAREVAELSQATGLEPVYRQIQALARQYESIRAVLPSGDARTRQMELIATKMRTLAIAAIPLLGQLKRSPSPGERLAAVEMLQMVPDAESLDWLAERMGTEKPFIEYHAAVALLSAARSLDDSIRPRVLAAIEQAKARLGPIGAKTDRWSTLEEAQKVASGSADHDDVAVATA